MGVGLSSLLWMMAEESLFSLSLWAPSQDSAQSMADLFQAHPERVYNGILGVLLGNGEDRT